MERLYTDIEGNPLDKKSVSKHHVFFRRTAKGKGGNVRQFINQRGLLLPLVQTVHSELHRNVDAPPLPSASLMHRIDMKTNYMTESNPYNRFLDIAEQIDSLSRRCPNTEHRLQCGRIAENLAQQAPFILEGQVLIQPVEVAV